MKTAFLLALAIVHTGCQSVDSSRPIIRFYREALKRSRDPEHVANANDLVVRLGCLTGCKRLPRFDENAIVVSDPDPKEREAVQIIVNPRVYGAMLDEEPSDEFLQLLEDNTRHALKNSRYVIVQLLPKK
jgi:hypothetical protein